jgi:hypothetical protein
MQVVSVTCWQRPALDWRVAADEFAGVHGARIHAAYYFGTSSTMLLELVWPIVSWETKPDSTAIREAARQRFGWLS